MWKPIQAGLPPLTGSLNIAMTNTNRIKIIKKYIIATSIRNVGGRNTCFSNRRNSDDSIQSQAATAKDVRYISWV